MTLIGFRAAFSVAVAAGLTLCSEPAAAASCPLTDGQTITLTGVVASHSINDAGGSNVVVRVDNPCRPRNSDDDESEVIVGGKTERFPGCKPQDRISVTGKIAVDDEPTEAGDIIIYWLNPTTPLACRSAN